MASTAKRMPGPAQVAWAGDWMAFVGVCKLYPLGDSAYFCMLRPPPQSPVLRRFRDPCPQRPRALKPPRHSPDKIASFALSPTVHVAFPF
jgi:hypothetical protein